MEGGETPLGYIPAGENQEILALVQEARQTYATTYKPLITDIYDNMMQSLTMGRRIQELEGEEAAAWQCANCNARP